MGNGMNKVLPGLYVGNYRDSKDSVQLDRYKITHILAIHDTARRLHADKHYLCVMASDSPDQNLTQYFPLCNDFIHAARLRDGNVLIHCLAGMSRSVTVAVAYIMSITNLNWRDGLKVVRAGRAVANPNLGFRRQLQDFESYKLLEERRRLKERYPSLALTESDKHQCKLMLDSYDELVTSKAVCEGKCALGRTCPSGICRNNSTRKPPRKPLTTVPSSPGSTSSEITHRRGSMLSRSPSILSTTSTVSGLRPRSSPAGLYSYTGRGSIPPSRCASRLDMNNLMGSSMVVEENVSSNGEPSVIVVGGAAWARRRATSAPSTPIPSPPASPQRLPRNARRRCT